MADTNKPIIGTSGNDTIYGTAGNDKINAGKGNDTVYSGAGNDKINAGNGNDIVYSNAGNDTVNLGAGNDTMVILLKDMITENSASKLVRIGGTTDIYDGGSGYDTIRIDLRGVEHAGDYQKAFVDVFQQYKHMEMGKDFDFGRGNHGYHDYMDMEKGFDLGMNVHDYLAAKGIATPEFHMYIKEFENIEFITNPPVAVADHYTTNEDTTLTGNILINDTDLDTAHGNLTAILTTNGGPQHGILTLNSNGSFAYTPYENYHGSDSFSYVAYDGEKYSQPTTVSITVASVNDAPVAHNDSGLLALTTAEDTVLTIAPSALLANDSDVDGDTLSVSSVTHGAHGTAAIVSNNIVYTPDANYNGIDHFTYQVSDGHGGTATATVTVNVTPVNDAPVAHNDSGLLALTTAEDTVLTIAPSALLANDSDVDGDTLSVSSVTHGAHGTAAIVSNNIVYTPDANYNGTDQLTYTVIDGHGGTATATVTVNVAPVNDAPVAQDDSGLPALTTLEDTALTIAPSALLANDSDVDGDTLSVSSVTYGAHGTAAIIGDNIVYTPNANYNGTDQLTYTVTDGHGGTATATVTVNVAPVNDNPVATADNYITAEDTALTIAPSALLANDSDVDGDTLSVSSVTHGAHGTAAIVSNNIVYTPDANYNGTDQLTYTVTDGHGGTATATITVNVAPVNDAPVAQDDSGLPALTTLEDTALTIAPSALLANDSDVDGDTLSVSSVTYGAHGTAAIIGDNIVYTPNANYNGTDQLTYTVTDGHGGTATATITVNVAPVNDNPVAAADNYITTEDTVLTGNVLGNDSDVDIGAAATATTAVAAAIAATAADPTATAAAVAAAVTAATSASDPAAIAAATAAADPAATAATVAAAVAAVAATTGGDVLSATLVDGAGPSHGSVALNSDGTFTYTPDANYNGIDHFTYQVSDGHGGTDTGIATITVTPVNDAPVAQDDSGLLALTTAEDTALTIAPSALLANDSDVDGDTLSVSSVTHGAHGTAAIVSNNIVYTPDANYNGTDQLTYTVTDGHGGTATATITVNVAPVNDAPVAQDDSGLPALTTLEDTALTIAPSALLANDSDVDGDTLSVSSVTYGAHGTAAIIGDNIVYTPNANYNGTDQLTYTVTDGHGGTATATVTVNVAPVNDNPVATADNYITTEDTVLTGNVLGNDSDVDIGAAATATTAVAAAIAATAADPTATAAAVAAAVTAATSASDPAAIAAATAAADPAATAATVAAAVAAVAATTGGDVLSATLVDGAGPSHGSVTLNSDGTFTYTPDANYNGIDHFTYQVSDGHGGTDTGIATITVTPVNDAPVAHNDSGLLALTTAEDTVLTIAPSALLANDSDVDGDTLSVSSVTHGAHGTAAIVGDNIVYTPDGNYSGIDQLTYTVIDGHGGTATGIATITVAPPSIPVPPDSTPATPPDSTPATPPDSVPATPPGIPAATAPGNIPATASASAIDMAGTPGADNFVITGSDLNSRASTTITNFTPGTGSDVIELKDVFITNPPPKTDGSNYSAADLANYLTCTAANGSTTITVDPDGTTGTAPTHNIVLLGTDTTLQQLLDNGQLNITYTA